MKMIKRRTLCSVCEQKYGADDNSLEGRCHVQCEDFTEEQRSRLGVDFEELEEVVTMLLSEVEGNPTYHSRSGKTGTQNGGDL